MLVYLPQLWEHNVDPSVDLVLDADETMDDCLPVRHENAQFHEHFTGFFDEGVVAVFHHVGDNQSIFDVAF